MSVLIVAAHPDDEVLGVGGTIAKLSAAGESVSVVFGATGISARYKSPKQHSNDIEQKVGELKQDARRAADVLGIEKLYFLDFPDNRLDTVAKMDLTHSLRGVVNETLPTTVFTHHPGDYNWDHHAMFEATLMACRRSLGEHSPQRLLSYEVLSSTERSAQDASHSFFPNTYEDISKTIELKKKALEEYRSELCSYPHPRSSKGVENLAATRGNEISTHFAEAFQLIREVRP